MATAVSIFIHEFHLADYFGHPNQYLTNNSRSRLLLDLIHLAV